MEVAGQKSHGRTLPFRGLSLALGSECALPFFLRLDGLEPQAFGCRDQRRDEVIELIFETLRNTKGNRTQAAKMLSISIRTLRNKLNEYAADGTLSLRGVRRPLTLTFSWAPGTQPVLSGKATVGRLDFGIGAGDWDDLELIPNAVAVSTRVLLEPAAASAAR